MKNRRVQRLNSLLKEVIAEVIQKEVKNPHLPSFLSVTEVEVTKDLHQAKVYISVIGSEEDKQNALKALESAAGFIAAQASKKMVIRYFPSLYFILDTSVEKYLHMEKLLNDIEQQRLSRPSEETSES